MIRATPRASPPMTMIAKAGDHASLIVKIPPTSANATSTEVPDELRCAYHSKPCGNLRATKVNGDLHKLCDHHRKRANINQQRVHLRRRLEKKQAKQLQQWTKERELATASELDASFLQCGGSPSSPSFDDLSMQDLMMLELILSYDSPAASPDAVKTEDISSSGSSTSSSRLSFVEQLQCVI